MISRQRITTSVLISGGDLSGEEKGWHPIFLTFCSQAPRWYQVGFFCKTGLENNEPAQHELQEPTEAWRLERWARDWKARGLKSVWETGADESTSLNYCGDFTGCCSVDNRGGLDVLGGRRSEYLSHHFFTLVQHCSFMTLKSIYNPNTAVLLLQTYDAVMEFKLPDALVFKLWGPVQHG